MSRLYDEMEVRRELRRACEAAGSQRAFALAHGLEESRVSDVLLAVKPPADKMLAALGYERVVKYTKIAS